MADSRNALTKTDFIVGRVDADMYDRDAGLVERIVECRFEINHGIHATVGEIEEGRGTREIQIMRRSKEPVESDGLLLCRNRKE